MGVYFGMGSTVHDKKKTLLVHRHLWLSDDVVTYGASSHSANNTLWSMCLLVY